LLASVPDANNRGDHLVHAGLTSLLQQSRAVLMFRGVHVPKSTGSDPRVQNDHSRSHHGRFRSHRKREEWSTRRTVMNGHAAD
jgi:hypothetical protein